MKIFCLVLCGLMFVSLSFAQNTEKPKPLLLPSTSIFILDDGCGNPATFSQTWDWREGIVIRVVDANTIVFKQETENGNKKERTLTVELVGIDTSINEKAIKKYLAKFKNTRVTVSGNLKDNLDISMYAIVRIGRGAIEINESLIEKGIARYKAFDLDHLIEYNEVCQLEKAEGRAKSAKLGVWANK